MTLFLCGAAIVLLFVCEYYGVTTISDVNLQHAADSATGAVKQSGDFLVKRLSSITSKGVSAAGGFFVDLSWVRPKSFNVLNAEGAAHKLHRVY